MVRIDRHQLDTASAQEGMAGEVHSQVAGEATRVLDQHHADAVGLTARE
jgi:hypothetical protein